MEGRYPAPRSSTCFPSRHHAEAPLVAPVRPPVRTVFPNTCRQLVGASTGACSVLATVVCPGSSTGCRGSRTRGFPGTPGRAAVNGPAGTALRRQGHSVARAEGPRHRRPRLRHETHRRGTASAASRPPQARARVVETVCLSAQPPADRSVQRLIQRRRWTAPAHGWAARPRSCPPSARQRARTEAAPCLTNPPPEGHSGKHRRRCALPVPLLPAAPQPPLGALRIAGAPGGKRHRRSCRFLGRRSAPPWASSQRGCRPASVPLWSFLPPWKALQCTAVGLLRQGQALQASVLADSGRRPCACRGDWRPTRVPAAVRACACVQRGGSVPPHPSSVAALRGWTNGLLLAGLCAAGHQWRVACSFP